jgi:hypothetical protein
MSKLSGFTLTVRGPSIDGVETGEVGAAGAAAGAAAAGAPAAGAGAAAGVAGAGAAGGVAVCEYAEAAQSDSAPTYRGYSFLFILVFGQGEVGSLGDRS